jgi:hypothetical protein
MRARVHLADGNEKARPVIVAFAGTERDLRVSPAAQRGVACAESVEQPGVERAHPRVVVPASVEVMGLDLPATEPEQRPRVVEDRDARMDLDPRMGACDPWMSTTEAPASAAAWPNSPANAGEADMRPPGRGIDEGGRAGRCEVGIGTRMSQPSRVQRLMGRAQAAVRVVE